jgi:Fic family protein
MHPFINGNGRTARAACYFVLCVKAGGWLPGNTILPELVKRDRDQYVIALRAADEGFRAGKQDYLQPLHDLLSTLLAEQLQSASSDKVEPVVEAPKA